MAEDINAIRVSNSLKDKYDLSIRKPYFRIYKYRFSIIIFYFLVCLKCCFVKIAIIARVNISIDINRKNVATMMVLSFG